MLKSKNILHMSVIFAVIMVNLFFGYSRLLKYTAVDETLWSYGRVPKFWQSIEKGNWKGTNLCDKPGVILAMISGAGLPLIPNPMDYGNLSRQSKTTEQLKTIESIYFHLRLPVYLTTLLSLFGFYFLIKRLLNDDVALFSTVFIGLSPILLGISLIVNTDALLWILIPLSILSFLIYQKEDNKKFLYLAGFILGLGILTKFVANLLVPFFLVLIFIKFILTGFTNTQEQTKYLKKALSDYLLLILITFLTIFIFYPSAWVKPRELFNVTIYSQAFANKWPMFVGMLLLMLADTYLLKSLVTRKISALFSSNISVLTKIVSGFALSMIGFVAVNVYSGMKFLNFETILADPKPDALFKIELFSKTLSAFFPLIYGLTPLVTFLFIAAIVLIAKATASQIKKNDNLMQIFYLLLFILVYYIANSIARIGSTVRYQIVIYPIASIIAAIGLYEIINLAVIKKYLSHKMHYLLIFIIIASSFASLNHIKPFYLAYSSILLPDKYILNMRDMGDGSWETSQFLNNLPNAKNLIIWSDKKQVCEKFIGKCETGFRSNDYKDVKFDYFVSSTGGMRESQLRADSKRNMTLKIGTRTVPVKDLYSDASNFAFKVNIGNSPSNYVGVLNAESIAIK